MDAYLSTRGAGPVPFAEALVQGLAPDGGLYVPASPPDLGGGAPPAGGSFTDTAGWAAPHLLPDAMAPQLLGQVVADALDFPMPLVEVERDTFVLELFHGPSLAFKDVGARFMAHAMAAQGPSGGVRTVLVATSGDTGGAVASAFHGIVGHQVVVLFPRHGISERQRRQMTTLGGNVGRLLPQAFYYLHAATELGWERSPATFVVPSGNLGNLCAGLLARRAGMPAHGFVAAANRNRPFVDYLESGVVEPRASVPTPSNAMDVGDPSNLERIRWLYGDDVERLRRDVRAYWVDDEATRACIRRVHAETGYVLDPHGAVGWDAMVQARQVTPGPWVVLATAHPWKFPEVVERMVGSRIAAPEELAERFSGPEHIREISAHAGALASLLLEEGGP